MLGRLPGGYVFQLGGLLEKPANPFGGEMVGDWQAGRLAAQETGNVLIDQRQLIRCLGQHALVAWGGGTKRGRVASWALNTCLTSGVLVHASE